MLQVETATGKMFVINPAIATIAFCFCLFRALPFHRFPSSIPCLGSMGFVGAVMIYPNYINKQY